MAKPTNPRDALHVKKALKAHGRTRWIEQVLAADQRAVPNGIFAPTIVDGLMLARAGLNSVHVRALLHGAQVPDSPGVYHEQWAVSLVDAEVAFAGALGTLPLKKYGARLPRFGPAPDSALTRFQEASATASSWPARKYFDQVVVKLGANRCDYVNARVTFSNGWVAPAAPNDVPLERLEWCYELPFGGLFPASRCYVASKAEVSGGNADPFSAKYTGWQFWKESSFHAESMETKGAERFSPESGEFNENPVGVDSWFNAFMSRLDPHGDVLGSEKRMASFTVHVYSGQKLADYIAAVAANPGTFGPP